MDSTPIPAVASVLEEYPDDATEKLLYLRRLVLEAANETDGVDDVVETLSWGEPSYKTAEGSTVRVDWKASEPDQFAMYFTCTTTLVETFEELYGDLFRFDGNRAIVFGFSEEIPEEELKHCISLALTYHRIKHLPLLGA